MTITVHDHAHTYELAWRATDDGPVITDLRVTSDSGAPITSDSLKRINTDRLARAAALYDTDAQAELGVAMRLAWDQLDDVMRNPDPAARVAGVLAEWEKDEFATLVASDLQQQARSVDELAEWLDDMYANAQHVRLVLPELSAAEQVAAMRAAIGEDAPKNRGGRPREYSYEFLQKVAVWAKEGALEGSVYQYVAQRAVDTGEKSEYDASPGAVRWWIKRCKEAGLLGPDELRKPRTRRKDR